MRKRLTLLAALLWGALAGAAPPTLTLPPTATTDPGEFLRVDAVTEGKQVRWFALDRGLSVFPSELLRDGKVTVVVGVKPGTFRLAAITSLNDELSELAVCQVTVRGDPVPPVPPGPTPPPPVPPPPDALGKAVADAYAADPDPRKADHAAALAGFYRQAALACGSPDLTTAEQLHQVLKHTAAGLVPDAFLAGPRRLVAAELGRITGTDPAARLTPGQRADAAALFGRLALLLGGLTRAK